MTAVGVEVVLHREGVSELVVSQWHISTIRWYSDIHVGRSGEHRAKENFKIQTTIHTFRVRTIPEIHPIPDTE